MYAKRIISALFITLVVLALCGPATARPINYIISYGDSLSDNGNFYAATGNPPYPYWNGRASNGPVWVEYFAAKTHKQLYDFAWFGATSGVGNGRDGGNQTTLGTYGLPGMLTEVSSTLGAIQPIASQSEVIVWGGANDFLTNGFGVGTVQTAVADIVTIVNQLQGIGVAKIVVPGMPDIGLTPDYWGNPGATALSMYFNSLLVSELPHGVQYVDTFTLMHEVVADPAAFGFTNVQDPCLNLETFSVCSNPDQYFSWDGFHPTTRGHELIAGYIEQSTVPEPSTLLMLGSGVLGTAGMLRRKLRVH